MKKIERFSVVRFAEWAAANGNQLDVAWEDRRKIEYRTYTAGNGAPIEYMILLSNMAGVSPWFSVPITGNSDYHRKYAELVRDKLRLDLTIYVEVGNEVWGTLYTQGQYAMQQGLKLNISTDGIKARMCYYALASKNVFLTWKDVFGSSQRSRLKFVI